MLAKAVLKIVEPTLRIAIAFLHLILFQLAVAEAQEKDRRAGDAAKDAFRDCADCPRNGGSAGRRITLMGSPPSERGRNPDEGPQRKVTFARPFAAGETR